MSKEPLVVAIIPAYNEAFNIGKVVSQAKSFVSKVIVCDDGSSDSTGEIAKASGAIVVTHEKNMGYGASLSTLFSEARKLNPDVTVCIDADGQHDPAYIPKLAEPILSNGTDIVIGSRFLSGEAMANLPPYRKVGINMITRLANRAAYSGITDAQSGFRAYSRKALKTIWPTEHGMGVSTEILIKAKEANLKIVEMPVVISYNGGTSTQNPIAHSFGVILTTLKLASVRRPQIFYGVPAVAALVVALGFWIRASLMYGATGQIWTDITFMALGATVISLIFAILAIVLWMLVVAVREVQTSEE